MIKVFKYRGNVVILHLENSSKRLKTKIKAILKDFCNYSG